jgi:RNA polymerase sigma factor (sigma-70 family)
MSVRSIEALQRYLRRLCDEAVPLEDAVLLNRFVAANDREAFELMVARHGPMVLGTARRLVHDSHDAEDVFQSVFLSLARLAKTIRHGRTLPAWLYKTTCRIAAKVHKDRVSGSREPHPEPCENVTPELQVVWREVRQVLDEELQRLPERLRSPLLLCYLSGLTRDEAAKQLGWSLGTLKRRLEEGRKTLRFRLEKRGFASIGLALTVFASETLQATVSQSLLESTLSMILSTGKGVSATISALVPSSAATMKGFAMKLIPAILAATAVGLGFYAGMSLAEAPRQPDDKKPREQPPKGTSLILSALDESKALQKPDTNPAKPEKPVRLTISHTDRFEFLTPDGKADGTPVVHPNPALLMSGTVSPRKRWFAYTALPVPGSPKEEGEKGAQVYICSLANEKKPLAVPVPARHLCWAPDESKLLAVEHPASERNETRPNHWLIDPKTGRLEQLTLPYGHVHDWSPDGKSFLMSVLDPKQTGARLAVVSCDGKMVTTLQQMKHPCWLELACFSPEGRTVLFGMPADEQSEEWIASLPRLFVLDVATKTKREPREIPLNASITKACWSPDGKRIAYLWRPIPLEIGKRKFQEVKSEDLEVETEEFVTVIDTSGKSSKDVAVEKGTRLNSVILTGLDWR